jgi:hypothetical protein
MREFFNHWQQVNTALGAGSEVTLAGNRTINYLEVRIPALDDARDAVTDAGVDRALAREELTELIGTLQGKLVEFNRRVRADFPGSALSRTLEEAFAIGDSEEKVRQGLRAMARLWLKINAISPAPEGVALPLVAAGEVSGAHGCGGGSAGRAGAAQ